MDIGAYFHSVFIRNKKSMSLRMTCQKLKVKKPSKALDRHAAGDQVDFSSPETNVDNHLTNVLQVDPMLQQAPIEPRRGGVANAVYHTTQRRIIHSCDVMTIFRLYLWFQPRSLTDVLTDHPNHLTSNTFQ
jgi:hypothetical protein